MSSRPARTALHSPAKTDKAGQKPIADAALGARTPHLWLKEGHHVFELGLLLSAHVAAGHGAQRQAQAVAHQLVDLHTGTHAGRLAAGAPARVLAGWCASMQVWLHERTGVQPVAAGAGGRGIPPSQRALLASRHTASRIPRHACASTLAQAPPAIFCFPARTMAASRRCLRASVLPPSTARKTMVMGGNRGAGMMLGPSSPCAAPAVGAQACSPKAGRAYEWRADPERSARATCGSGSVLDFPPARLHSRHHLPRSSDCAHGQPPGCVPPGASKYGRSVITAEAGSASLLPNTCARPARLGGSTCSSRTRLAAGSTPLPPSPRA